MEDLNIEVEDDENTNKIPHKSHNPQPLPKLPQPNPLPKNPSQTQRWIKPRNGHISSWNVSYGADC